MEIRGYLEYEIQANKDLLRFIFALLCDSFAGKILLPIVSYFNTEN